MSADSTSANSTSTTSTSQAPVLETRGLTKAFRGFTAVDNVNLSVQEGHIHALIGPNGAGKTTVFNLLTKFLPPTRGEILYRGKPITALKSNQIARLGLVRSFQISAVFAHMTALENVRVALQRQLGTSFHFWKSEKSLDHLNERALALLEEVGLREYADTLTVEMPYGRKRALEVATTLALDPVMMLLDEPTQGMGAEDVDRIVALIKRVSKGRTVLMVEHNLSVVSRLCDQITVLARGAVLAEGDYQSVSRNPLVREAYMGSDAAEQERGQRMSIADAATVDTQAATPSTHAQSREILRIKDLHAFYGESHILHGVNVDVKQGELVTLLGRNGAGRSTTLKAIMNMVGRRTGSIVINGQETLAMKPHHIPRLGIGYCPEERGIFSSLDVHENLLLPPTVSSGGMSLDDIYAMFPNLYERRKSQGTRLSGGEQQMLAMARILRTGARLLLLDEITEGLAPVIVQKLGEVLVLLKAQGMTIVLVEQNFRFAAPLADRHFVMDHGQIVEEISAAQLPARREHLNSMLGV